MCLPTRIDVGVPWVAPAGLQCVPQVPLGLECQADLCVPARQRVEQQRCVRTHGATALAS
jgi:hypothetical protein